MIPTTFSRGRALTAALACTLLSLAGAGRAAATTFQVSFDSTGHGIVSAIKYNGNVFDVFMGQYNMHVVGGPSFESFCVDLDHAMHTGQTFLVQPRSTSDGLPQGPQIAYLYNSFGQAVVPNSEQAAGLQLAFWELETDGVGGSLSTGNFQYAPGLKSPDDYNAIAANWANYYLTLAASHTDVSTWLDGSVAKPQERGQSVLFPGTSIQAQQVAGVPEPASALLLGLGLAGAAAYRRYRRPMTV